MRSGLGIFKGWALIEHDSSQELQRRHGIRDWPQHAANLRYFEILRRPWAIHASFKDMHAIRSCSSCSSVQYIVTRAAAPWTWWQYLISNMFVFFRRIMKLWMSIYTTGISKPFNAREKMACKAVLNRTGVPRKNLWKICCDLVRYDGFGSEECFGSELQGWEARRCCSSLQDRNLTTRLWARVLFPTDIRSVKPVSQNISRFAIVAYHKSGATLSYVIATLPELSLLLLGRGFRNFGWAKSYSTSHIPTYQGGVYLQTHRSLQQRVITYWLSPMEMRREEISSNYLVPGLGKAVHMVRKPSDMVVSGYLYHIRSREAWQTLTDPPNCDACDHQAWKNIFSTSNFNCSYEKLLRRSWWRKDRNCSFQLGYAEDDVQYEVLERSPRCPFGFLVALLQWFWCNGTLHRPLFAGWPSASKGVASWDTPELAGVSPRGRPKSQEDGKPRGKASGGRGGEGSKHIIPTCRS